MEDALDEARVAPRNLLELPPVLHRSPEAHRHGRPRRAAHEEVRRTDVGEPQESRKGQEGNSLGCALAPIFLSILANRCRTAWFHAVARPSSIPPRLRNAKALAACRSRARCS